MSRIFKFQFTLLLFFLQTECRAEFLGKISDDTAQLPTASQPATANQTKILYKVICTESSEQTPDCDQPAIADYIDQAETDVKSDSVQANSKPEDNIPASDSPLLAEQIDSSNTSKQNKHSKKKLKKGSKSKLRKKP